MDAVMADVERLVKKELLEANKKFPLFHSPHEGAAVIKEEIEEAEEELREVKELYMFLWKCVKENNPVGCERGIYDHAIGLAVEAIQIAAMAQKFINSQKEREKSDGTTINRKSRHKQSGHNVNVGISE